MSSGFGLNGGKLSLAHASVQLDTGAGLCTWQWLIIRCAGPSRCFPFWQEVLACYVVNTNTDDDSGKRKCAPVLEDYYECLHHKKEVRCAKNQWTQASPHHCADQPAFP